MVTSHDPTDSPMTAPSILAMTSVDARSDLLGRGVILRPDQDVPDPWLDQLAYDALTGGDRVHDVTVDDELLGTPDRLTEVVTRLHTAWVTRTPVVVRLAVEPTVLREPEAFTEGPHAAGVGFTFPRERLRFLIRSNNYDLRDGTPIWWPARTAVHLGATICDDGNGDVILPDGTRAWIDGGPRGVEEVAGLPVIHRETVEQQRLTPDQHWEPTFPLAPDQYAAVTHRSGPARIIAPAGSGKTRVLTQRIETLIGRGWNPDQILAVAYNTRAAEEMRDRLPSTAADVRTVHSFALDVIREHARLHQRRYPRTIDEREVREILSGLVDMRASVNSDPLAPWIAALASCRLALIAPGELAESLPDDMRAFPKVYERYQRILSERNLVDFDEMLFRACHLMLSDPVLRGHVQHRVRHVLIDETQDAFPATMLLVRLAAAPELDVFAVGDPQQSVYGYAGADPRFMTDFGRWFPGFVDHPLTVNYRCPVEVVESVNRLLLPTPVSLPSPISPAPSRGKNPDSVRVLKAPTQEVATTAVRVVHEWIAAGHDPREIAVLCRVNSGLMPVQVMLSEDRAPYAPALSEAVLDRTMLRAALAYLRLAEGGASAPLNGTDLFEVANRPGRFITRKTRDVMRDRTDWTRDLLLSVVAEKGTAGDVTRVEGLIADLMGLRRMWLTKTTTTRLLDYITDKIGLGTAAATLDGSKGVVETNSHSNDIDALRDVTYLHPDPAGFEAWLRAALARPGTPDGVRLATVHRTKGLEWDRVLVLNATGGLMPHDANIDEQEELRVFHVAATRCREHITFVANAKHPSPYLAAGKFGETSP